MAAKHLGLDAPWALESDNTDLLNYNVQVSIYGHTLKRKGEVDSAKSKIQLNFILDSYMLAHNSIETR